jgi:hypothetical protein
MSYSDFNPRAQDAKQKLKTMVLETREWRKLDRHHQRSEVFKLLDRLVQETEGKEQDELLYALCTLYDKSPQAEEVYVRTMAQTLCWERFLKMAESSPLVDKLGLSARKLELINPHLEKENLTLPFGESRDCSGVSEPASLAIRKRLFKIVDSLEQPVARTDPKKKHPRASGVGRTNQEWVEQFLGGGRFSRPLYDVLRSSESGFQNYRRMLAERPDCQGEIPDDRELLFPLSESQFAEFWELLNVRARRSLAPVLVNALSGLPSLETSLLLCEADSAEAGVARLEKFRETLGRPESQKRVLRDYPRAQPALRRLLGPGVIPLPVNASPSWTVDLGDLDTSTRMLLVDNTIIISTERSIRCIDAFTGKLLWRHRGSSLPILVHRVGEDVFLAGKSRIVMRVVVNKQGLETRYFEPRTSTDALAGRLRWKGGSIFYFVAIERPWGSTCFCLKSLTVTKTGDRLSQDGYPKSAEIPTFSLYRVNLEEYDSRHRIWFEPWEGTCYAVPAKTAKVGEGFTPYIQDKNVWACISTKFTRLLSGKKRKSTLAYWKKPPVGGP